MIRTLSIKNFQSHKNSKLEFEPGVNVIIGSSDSGKTAIVRALRWLIWNRPAGDEFRSRWGGDTVVDIEFDEGHVYRIRTDKTNLYMLGIDDFKALKSDVPDEIKKLINMNEINLQQQLDSPFLISSTPGEVAQHFNHIAHLDSIDFGLKNIQSWYNSLNQQIKLNEERLIELKERAASFDYLQLFESDVEVLEEMQQRLTKLIQAETKLETLINNIKDVNAAIKEEQAIVPAEKDIENILKMYEELESKQNSADQLGNLISDIFDNEQALDRALDLFTQLEAGYKDNFPDICPLCEQPVK